MSWWRRFWRPSHRRVESLYDVGEGRVELAGRVERAEETLVDPIDGRDCVALDYRAWPPSSLVGIDGATAHAGRAFQLQARQSVDFVVVEGDARVLVRAAGGDDVGHLHQQLLAKYGVGLRAEVDLIPTGVDVRVAGHVKFSRASGEGSPMRAEPYNAIVVAERFWLPGGADAG